MFAAESCVTAADGGALPLLKEPQHRQFKYCYHRNTAQRGTNTTDRAEYCCKVLNAETFLVKDTVLDEFLQELSDGSGSFFTSVR